MTNALLRLVIQITLCYLEFNVSSYEFLCNRLSYKIVLLTITRFVTNCFFLFVHYLGNNSSKYCQKNLIFTFSVYIHKYTHTC